MPESNPKVSSLFVTFSPGERCLRRQMSRDIAPFLDFFVSPEKCGSVSQIFRKNDKELISFISIL